MVFTPLTSLLMLTPILLLPPMLISPPVLSLPPLLVLIVLLVCIYPLSLIFPHMVHDNEGMGGAMHWDIAKVEAPVVEVIAAVVMSEVEMVGWLRCCDGRYCGKYLLGKHLLYRVHSV